MKYEVNWYKVKYIKYDYDYPIECYQEITEKYPFLSKSNEFEEKRDKIKEKYKKDNKNAFIYFFDGTSITIPANIINRNGNIIEFI